MKYDEQYKDSLIEKWVGKTVKSCNQRDNEIYEVHDIFFSHRQHMNGHYLAACTNIKRKESTVNWNVNSLKYVDVNLELFN